MTSVYDRVHNDEYKTKLPYPSRPVEPDLLRKKPRDMSADEMAALPALAASYAAAKEAYAAAKTAYNQDQHRLDTQFRADLEEESGMTGHPKASLLWDKAYDRGHSSGMGEVCIIYDDLLELVK